MADRKISDLTALTTPASGDYLPIVDISEASAANKNKRITIEELLRGAPDGTAAAPSIAFESDPNTGIYSPGADAFGVVTGGTERTRIDSSGRLLVGTSTAFSVGADAPYAKIQIVGNSFSSTGPASIALGRGELPTAITSGEEIGKIVFSASDGSQFGIITCDADANAGAGDYPGRLTFSTTADGASSPTERMRIGQDGNVLIGTTNTATGARIFCSTANNASSIYTECTNASQTFSVLSIVSARNTTDGTYKAIEYYNSGATATRFQVLDSGNVQNTNNSYTAISDVKLKENIVDASSQWDDIKALRVRNYNLKSDQTHRQIGVVAQEAELVSPGLVADIPDYDRDGNDLGTVTKSVNYSVLYMKAVKALQEAMERIEILEQRLSDAGIN